MPRVQKYWNDPDYIKKMGGDNLDLSRSAFIEEQRSEKNEQLRLQNTAIALSDLKFAELINPDHLPTLKLLANTYRALGDKETALEYWRKLASKDDEYLMMKYHYIYRNYLVAGHSFTGKNSLFTREKRYELCQALYDATSSGDYYAIDSFRSNKKFTCRDFSLELNQSRFPQVLAELNDKIRLWETEHNFKNSYDAEKAFKHLFDEGYDPMSPPKFIHESRNYLWLRYVRGKLKLIMGQKNGVCKDLMSHLGWGNERDFMRQKAFSIGDITFVKDICGKNAYSSEI